MTRKEAHLPLPPGCDPSELTLFEQAIAHAFGALSGTLEPPNPARDALEAAREKCRAGNPFPLVALQWPEMVLTDAEEIEIFARHMRPERFEKVTDSIRRACFDPANPPLRLDWWQKIIIAAYFDPSIAEINIKGCTGAGKGGCTSMATCLWYDVYEQSRTTLTGRDKEHSLKNIFGETKKWFEQMQYPAAARVLGESIGEHARHYIRTLNPDPSSATAGEAFSGAHGGNTLTVFDEASAHPDSFFENAAKNSRKLIRLSNPRQRLGSFYRAFEKMGADRIDEIGVCYGTIGLCLNVTVGGMDCMNVAEKRLKLPVAPGGGIEIAGVRYEEGTPLPMDVYERYCKPLIPEQMDVTQFQAALAQPLSDCFAHGRFPKEDAERQLILASWFPRHEEAWRALGGNVPVTCYGLDVARSLDGDKTVLASGSDVGLRELRAVQLDNTPKIVDWAIAQARADGIDLLRGQVPICVDYGGGYGSGVGDRLEELGAWVLKFQPNGTSGVSPRHFSNLRTEAYATLGLRLDPRHEFGKTPWALPDNSQLRKELCAPERVFAPDMVRFRVLPKDEIKSRLGCSPDYADAATYLFYAVRTLYNLNDWLLTLKQPLIASPSAEELAAERSKTSCENSQQSAAPETRELLEYLAESAGEKLPRERENAPYWARYLSDE